uniref:Uncharacterized protein n=1 Tax=viral metagenome TaxID=1070528 RepID=A0A6C0EEJ5_9ZZZZ
MGFFSINHHTPPLYKPQLFLFQKKNDFKTKPNQTKPNQTQK